MMTAGRRCVLLGWIDINVDIDEDDSLMLREERTMKAQQSFTTRFRREKLAVIFSRTWDLVQSDSGRGRGQASGCTRHRPCQARLTLDMLASVSRNRLPRSASRHCRSVRIQTQEGSVCWPSLPRTPRMPSLLRCCNLDLHSQFGPLRMGMHCGKKGGGLVDGRPGREHELDTPRLEPGSVRTHSIALQG